MDPVSEWRCDDCIEERMPRGDACVDVGDAIV